MRKFGLQLKNKFWKANFTGVEKLEEGFYHIFPKYMGEMVIWDTPHTNIEYTSNKVTFICS